MKTRPPYLYLIVFILQEKLSHSGWDFFFFLQIIIFRRTFFFSKKLQSIILQKHRAKRQENHFFFFPRVTEKHSKNSMSYYNKEDIVDNARIHLWQIVCSVNLWVQIIFIALRDEKEFVPLGNMLLCRKASFQECACTVLKTQDVSGSGTVT